MKNKTVVIAGGGLGALSGAIRLAKLGFKVILFEKNASPGGKINELHEQGFRFDTGPSLITMPFIIDELFTFAGVNRSDVLDLVAIDPICRYFFSDGLRFDASANPVLMNLELQRVFPHEIESFDRFLKYSAKIFETGSDVFLYTPIHEIRKLLHLNILKRLLKFHRIDPFRTVDQGVRRFFKDPRLIQIFNRYATYNGSNPFVAPATLNIIPYVEYGIGGFYIRGGIYRLVEQLSRLALQLGVQIHTSSKVDKITHLQGKITGVQVGDHFIPADYVVSGVDVVETFTHLIDGMDVEKNRLNRLEPSLSGMVFLWGVDRQFPKLQHHNIVFSADYYTEFVQLFEERKAPDDPTIYISISSKTDPGDAPAGMENWFVLLNMPYLTAEQDWQQEKKRIRKLVFDKLSHHHIDIEPYIMLEKIYTPEDFSRLYASNKGSIYGISSNSRSTAFRRPANRSRTLKGLYFAGGSVHPGGGIPLVMLSGKMTAELIAENEGVRLNQNNSFKIVLETYKNLHRNAENSMIENLKTVIQESEK